MPTRILRDGLLDSESWLGLKNNDDRVCWLTLFLKADVFGNQPSGLLRIVHLCRFAGIDTTEKAAKVLDALADADLLRLYEVDGKPYAHIPRYQQSLRYLGKVWPLSPWNTIEEKQRLTKISPVKRESITGDLMHEVDVDVEGFSGSTLVKNAKPEKQKSSALRALFVLPDWIPKEHWDAWIEARTKARKPITDYAKRLAVRKLDNYRERGHPPAQVLMKSAMNGWADLFEPKE